MGNLFIRRPILAMVIAIVMVIVGLVSMGRLPIAQYPDITPGVIQVTTTFTGASATDVENSVATPIEQQVNGADNMIYVKSTNGNDGTLTSEVSFDVGTNLDVSTMLVQNRVGQANAQLPGSVKQYGITTKKSLTMPLLVIDLTSPKGTWDNTFLVNYAGINIQPVLNRINGVGDVKLMGGTDYSMRVWVRPDRLLNLGLTVSDLTSAISAQNDITPAGQFGGPPAPAGTQFTYTVKTAGRLSTPEEFGNIIIRSNPDGSQVRLKDVARVELGSLSYLQTGRSNGKPGAVICVYQAPGSNALAVRKAVVDTMDQMALNFPSDTKYLIGLDTTLPISLGIEEIVRTLFEAVLLVLLVVFVFLQNWRATLIPLLAVPVSLIATFAVFPLLGFSINVLSLLGLVLAIGIVVDDAIVVVEAVMHHMEHGMSPKEATEQAMREVSGPVIAIALILISVFVPVAFMGGITGRLYQQFAVTIALSVAFSAFNALTLSPALASLVLKAKDPNKKGFLDPFYNRFNKIFGRTTDRYTSFTSVLIRKGGRSIIFIGILLVLIGALAKSLPMGFVPNEDNGYFFVSVQLPPAASKERTDAVMRKVEQIILANPAFQNVSSATGLNLITNTQAGNAGVVFVQTKPWDERKNIRERTDIAIQLLNLELYKQVPEAQAFAYGPPAIPGLGSGAGFSFMLEDLGSSTPEALADLTNKFIAEAKKRPEIGSILTFYQASEPQIYADVDRDKAQKLGVPIQSVNQTLGALLGSAYINDFNRFGKVYRVFLQAEPEYRTSASSFNDFFVRSGAGEMVPLSSLVTTRSTLGPTFTVRFNLHRAAEISGLPADGYSTDDAHRALEETAAKVLPAGFGYEWAYLSYQEVKASGTGAVVFVFAMLFVFLILAAQYESWSLPFSVLLGTPFAAFGAFLGLWSFRKLLPAVWGNSYVDNVFAQIGMITLIGLAAKNAILIVEFAKEARDHGKSAVDAALEAARLRFRPILMTAFAFILGVLPLVTASGAMAESRKVIGVTVFVGMLVATILGVCLIPVLFVLVDRFNRKPSTEKPDSGGSPR